jgi:hypothetical protein
VHPPFGDGWRSSVVMVQANDFHLASCQATLFTPDADVSASLLMRELLPKWGDRFDGDPVMMPSLEGLPIEVPRIILESKSHEWRCEIALARVSIFQRKVSQDGEDLVLANFYSDASQMLAEYASTAKPRVARLAALVNWFAVHDAPGLLLARHFCNEQQLSGPMNRPENFELHAHKRYALLDTMVNSWVRNKSGRILLGTEPGPIVVVEQDLNTLAEEADSRSFNEQQFRAFFEMVPNELVHILQLYYPTE